MLSYAPRNRQLIVASGFSPLSLLKVMIAALCHALSGSCVVALVQGNPLPSPGLCYITKTTRWASGSKET